MIKPTKRKAFNFLRSYFDVFNELETDADKLDFLTSIINKQFLNEDPKELNFIVNIWTKIIFLKYACGKLKEKA